MFYSTFQVYQVGNRCMPMRVRCMPIKKTPQSLGKGAGVSCDTKVLMGADCTDEKGGDLVSNQGEGVACPFQRLYRDIVGFLFIGCIEQFVISAILW